MFSNRKSDSRLEMVFIDNQGESPVLQGTEDVNGGFHAFRARVPCKYKFFITRLAYL